MHGRETSALCQLITFQDQLPPFKSHFSKVLTMSIRYESRQDWATKSSLFWQKDGQFWSRYGQTSKANYSRQRQSAYLNEAMGYRKDQPEY